MKFFIEQLALCPRDPAAAIQLLSEMGLAEWARDHVVAAGSVRGVEGTNEADLAFNYESTREKDPQSAEEAFLNLPDGHLLAKPLELEVLHYTSGPNWMESHAPSASHLGMHCSEEELARWHEFFTSRGIRVAQEVRTQSHTNPVISGKRFYTYVIYHTRPILGIDVKLISRRDV